MIIVQLSGGLGNQMFQYAAGLEVARRNKVELKVDVSGVATDKLRNLELNNFQTEPELATETELAAVIPRGLFEKVWQLTRTKNKRTWHRERSFFYDPSFEAIGPNAYLKGYFQSEKYFQHVQDELRSAFQLKASLTDRLAGVSDGLRKQLSVSVHIRRADYLRPEIRKIHGLLSVEYYLEAIRRIKTQYPQAIFYFFSDDITWVSENFKIPGAVMASSLYSRSALDDFYLMSQCQHNIIANSSFSWWCAWLNNNPTKQVIAPRMWFASRADDNADRIPVQWTSLQVKNMFQ